jgi:hypothetical protein
MELSRPINMLKLCGAISRVNVFSVKMLSRIIAPEDYTQNKLLRELQKLLNNSNIKDTLLG